MEGNEPDEVKNRLALQLEGQDMLEAKTLLDKLKELNDVTDLLTTQWVPLTTNMGENSKSTIMAFIKAEVMVGYGAVLFHQVKLAR